MYLSRSNQDTYNKGYCTGHPAPVIEYVECDHDVSLSLRIRGWRRGPCKGGFDFLENRLKAIFLDVKMHKKIVEKCAFLHLDNKKQECYTTHSE